VANDFCPHEFRQYGCDDGPRGAGTKHGALNSSEGNADSGKTPGPSASSVGLPADRDEVLLLGPQKTPYVLQDKSSCAVAIVQNLLDEVEQMALHWPVVGSADTRDFADRVLAFARRARSFKTRAGNGLRGGQSPTHAYHAKSFCRAVLLIIEQYYPALCDDLRLAEIGQWTPDENAHLASIADMRGDEARRIFGLTPLMMGCWSCLINTIPGTELEHALDFDPALLMGIFRDYEASVCSQGGDAADPPFAPGPRILFQMYMEKHGMP
jgi:hypothetical protein